MKTRLIIAVIYKALAAVELKPEKKFRTTLYFHSYLSCVCNCDDQSCLQRVQTFGLFSPQLVWQRAVDVWWHSKKLLSKSQKKIQIWKNDKIRLTCLGKESVGSVVEHLDYVPVSFCLHQRKHTRMRHLTYKMNQVTIRYSSMRGWRHFQGKFLHNNEWNPGARFSKVPKSFRTRKAIAKSPTMWLQSCFIHIFLIWAEVLFMQEVSGVYSSLSLKTNWLKMALRAWKVSGAFEKRAPG